MFGSVAVIFKCTFLRGIEWSLLRKNISNFAEAMREKRFTTMMPLGMSRDVTCHRLWHHKCFSNSIQFKLIYFISIWTSQNLLKFRTFLCIRKRNELFDHPSYILILTRCSPRDCQMSFGIGWGVTEVQILKNSETGPIYWNFLNISIKLCIDIAIDVS